MDGVDEGMGLGELLLIVGDGEDIVIVLYELHVGIGKVANDDDDLVSFVEML